MTLQLSLSLRDREFSLFAILRGFLSSFLFKRSFEIYDLVSFVLLCFYCGFVIFSFKCCITIWMYKNEISALP